MMAKAVIEGAESVQGIETELLKIGTPFSISKLNTTDAVIFGSPIIYNNVTPEMDDFLESLREKIRLESIDLSGKKGGAFGSYAFSGGWVIRKLVREMEELGVAIVTPPITSIDGMRKPVKIDKKTFEKCFNLGKIISKSIISKN
jgi:multimeric flavodoxin WrbA